MFSYSSVGLWCLTPLSTIFQLYRVYSSLQLYVMFNVFIYFLNPATSNNKILGHYEQIRPSSLSSPLAFYEDIETT